MIPYKQGVILSVNAILLCLCVILWFPIHQQHLVRNVLNSIAINEELYFMDVLMFGSISTLVDTHRFTDFITNSTIVPSSLFSIIRNCFCLLLFITSISCLLFLYAYVYGDSPFTKFKQFHLSKASIPTIFKWWILGFCVVAVFHSFSISSINDSIVKEELLCSEKQDNRFSYEIASIVCKSPEISVSNQFYSLLFCLLYLCLFALFFLLTHRDSAVNFPIHLCLGLLLILFFNSFLTHLTTLRLLLSTFFSLFSLPLYLTFTDIFPLPFLHLLTSLLHHLSLLYYSYQTFYFLHQLVHRVSSLPSSSSSLPLEGKMKQQDSSILPLLQSWREMCFVLFMNPFILSFLLLFFFAFITHYLSSSQSYFSLCLFLFLNYMSLPAVFIYSRKIHESIEHLFCLHGKNDWFSELVQVLIEINNSNIMTYLKKIFHWISHLFLQIPQFLILFLILLCESIHDQTTFSFLFLLSNCLLLFHANHIQSLYLTLLLHHHSSTPSIQQGLLSNLLLFFSHSLAGFSYYSIRKLIQVVCALSVLFFILYGSYYLLPYLQYWNWLQSTGTILILTYWINTLSTTWVEYQTICVLIDFCISYSHQANQFFSIYHSISYSLAIPFFLLYKSIQWVLHQQPSLHYTSCMNESNLPVKAICKPSFTMYHGLPILEGKEQRKLDELKTDERKCVWKSKRRKNVNLIKKLHFDDLRPAVKNEKEKVEEKREWKMEIPSVEPYCFMAEECCMSELSSYISQQPVQEETTDKKLI